MMKKYSLYLLLFFTNYNCLSQSLGINETIKYLNKLSFENQYYRQGRCDYSGYYQFSIEKTGLLSIYCISTIKCKDSKDSQMEITDTKWLSAKFYIDDIDIENLKTYNYSSDEKEVKINCLYDDKCMTSINSTGERSQRNSAVVQTSDRYNKNRLFNALTYLLTSAPENGYKRGEENDPFVTSPNKSIEKVKTKSNGNNTPGAKRLLNSRKEYRIPLKVSHGVFTLNGNVNGLSVNFILDSGAGETNISSKTESKLIANGLIRQSNYLSNGLYQLADGSIVECKRVRIPKIAIGGKIIYDVIASIGGENSPNLLGQSFLNKTFKWSIDNYQKVLLLY